MQMKLKGKYMKIIILTFLLSISLSSQEFTWDEPVNVTHVVHQERCNDPSICVDKNGGIHIVYWYNYNLGTKYLMYSHYDGIEWIKPDTLYKKEAYSVYSPIIKLNSKSKVFVCFTVIHNEFSRTFYTTKKDTGWVKPIQISEDNLGSSTQYDFLIDSNDNINVFFSTGEIYRKFFNGETWSNSERISIIQGTAYFLSSAVDSNNRLHIVYTLQSDERLYYLKFNDLIWTTPVSISTNSAYESSLITDGSNNVHVTWRHGHEIYYTNNIDGIWSTPVNVSNLKAISVKPKIQIVNDNPIIFFHTEYDTIDTKNKHYAVWENNKWQVKKLTTDSVSFLNFDFTLDAEDNPHLALIRPMNPQSWNVYHVKGQIITSLMPANHMDMNPNEKIIQYPNPFNQSATIKFVLSNRKSLKIKIFNINGKEVCNLVNNKIYNPGEYSVTWKGTTDFGKEVSSGIYILAVFFDNKLTSTNKLLLIR